MTLSDPKVRPAPARIRGLLFLGALLLALTTVLWTGAGHAQSTFPIPGMGGGSGGGASAEADSGAAAPADPTAALIEILRDDAAREALISRLEQSVGSGAPAEPAPSTSGAGAPAAAENEAPHAGNLSLRLVETLRQEILQDFHGFMARVDRIPTTFALALRGLNTDILLTIARDLGQLLLISYGALYVLRLMLMPLARRLDRKGTGKNWLQKLWLRSLATMVQTIPIPLAGFIGITSLSLMLQNSGAGAAAFSTAQAAFFAAFMTVELSKIPGRFFLSPGLPNLRLASISDFAANRAQWVLAVAVSLAGYGQLVAVPVVTAETSVFVGRAVSTLLGTLVVLYLIAVVLRYRSPIADWLRREGEHPTKLDRVLALFSDRWHWAVLAYFGYVLIVVLTRPGNVLGPLVIDTFKVVAILGAGGTVTMLARRATAKRVTLPETIHSRLPLLANRLNRLLPAGLIVVRILVVAVVIASVLSVFGVFDLGAFVRSEAGAGLISAIFGVAVTAIFVSVIYLAMSSWVDYQLNPFVGTPPTPRMVTLLTLLRNAVTIVLVIFALMFGLSELGLNIGPLLASAGVLGLAISFGAQKLVEDIITGVFIQFENAMNVGDVVDVGGVVGAVEKLTVRSVTLRDVQGVVHMIPFSSASMISNYMREFSYYVCDMGVAYREDIEESKKAMFDAFEELRRDPDQGGFILADLEWFGLNSFGDSAIVLRARIKTQPGKQWGVGRAYNLILKRIFDERGIEIPFPHQTIYFGEDRKGKAPPIHVMMQTTDEEASKAYAVVDAKPDASGPEQLDLPASNDDQKS